MKKEKNKEKMMNLTLGRQDKENLFGELVEKDDSKQSLVNLQKCMKQLYILKEKDQEIDNRFKKINQSRKELE